MLDLIQKASSLGKRLAEAGREARHASVATTGHVTDQMTQTFGAAAGEVVRAAVCGAVSAIIHGSRTLSPPVGAPHSMFRDPWEDEERFRFEEYEVPPQVSTAQPPELTEPARPGWTRAARMTGTVLTVAAGAAASVPGGRLVAAGLGAAAAVVSLAARAGENTSS